MAAIPAPNLHLPWSSAREDDNRFWRLFFIGLVPFFALSIGIPLITVPEPSRKEQEQLPPQLARVLLEKKELPKPPEPLPVTPKPEEKKPEEKKPEEKKPEEKKPEVKPQEKKPEPKPVQLNPSPVPAAPAANPKLEQAKAEAAAVLNEVQDDLAAMRESLALDDVAKPTAALSSGETSAAASVDRAIITSGAQGKSGGINSAALSKDTGGGGQLGARKAGQVSSKLKDAEAAAAAQQQAASAGGGKGTRTDEEVKKVLDAAKSRITAVYYRTLDEDPTLQGRMVFKITIAPSGSVSDVKLVSSDLKNADLERKIAALLRGLNFGARDVAPYTQTVPIDLFPS
jgi:periplasmic protein TonB